LSGGKVYLTTALSSGSSVTLHVLRLDAADGKIDWDVEVLRPDAAAARAMHGKNSLASSTPLVAGDRLYAHFGHLGTAALDLSGNVLWRQTSIKYQPVHGNGGSPIFLNDLLIFNCDGGSSPFIAALDAASGEVKWKTPRNTPARSQFSFSTPLAIEVDGQTQVISPASGFVGAYEPRTGRELWRVTYGEGYSVVPRPVFAGGLLFVSSGFDSPVAYAIRPQGASGDATAAHVAWTSRRAAPTTPSMLVLGDELYMVSDIGIASCSDAKTGKVHWSHRLRGGFSASPVSAEGRVYFQNEEGIGFVVKADKTFTQLSQNDLGERSLASYAVTDGALFIRTEKHLWKIGGK
jgi:glucose dehydrogenase